jgi:hypothetical protein
MIVASLSGRREAGISKVVIAAGLTRQSILSLVMRGLDRASILFE